YEDAKLFAGREIEVKKCVQKLLTGDEKILILYGASGCGKSSFLEAGLLPSICNQKPQRLVPAPAPTPRNPTDFLIRPRQEPMKALCGAVWQLCLQNSESTLDLLGAASVAEFVDKVGQSGDALMDALSSVLLKVGGGRQTLLLIDQAEEALRPLKEEI